MERKMLKFMPKAVTFQNQPFSPGKFKTHVGKGFSGPLFPAQTRRKPKEYSSTEETQEEPTSPQVSCIGQIKQKHKQKCQKKKNKKFEYTKKKPSFGKFFTKAVEKLAKPEGKRSGAAREEPTWPERAPNLGQMRRFASGRDTLSGFDWKAQVAPMAAEHGDYYSDEEIEGEEKEVIIPFSAPIIVGELKGYESNCKMDLKPKNEINLWKRRTMAQPRPLHVTPLN